MKIEIFKPFGEAFDLTKKILFQPFDLGKWCVIGFAAFLANLGGGYNFNFNFNTRNTSRGQAEFRGFTDWLHEIPSWMIGLGVIALIVVVLAVIMVFAWLRARGRFMFIDCVVKNRGAIKEPWREFQREGNSLFLFSLLIGVCFVVGVLVLSVPFVLLLVHGAAHERLHNVYFILMIVLCGSIVIILSITWALIVHFMIPVMYRRRCRAADAFRTVCSLIASYPGEIVLYCLFWIVLVLAVAMTGCLATCATCCLTIIPYVGTVILLPLFVCLRAFSLLFLRQFGSEYDVWVLPPLVPPAPPVQPASA